MDENSQSSSRGERLNYWRNWIAFFILGTINNLSYVVVGSAAQSLSNSLNHPNLLGLIPWANVGLGIFVRSLNTFALENTPILKIYFVRMSINSLFYAVGLIGLSVSIYYLQNFFVALICIVIVGGTSSFGESVLLGYLRRFDPSLIDGWSSGTGMAGVGGSLLYLAFQALHFSNSLSFLLLLPFVVVYFLTYAFLLRKSPNWEQDNQKRRQHLLQQQQQTEENDETTRVVLSVNDPEALPHENLIYNNKNNNTHNDMASEVINESIGTKYKRCFKIVWWLALQLALVYMFEYIVSSGASDKANPKNKDHQEWVEKNAYVILSFCYQAGVLVSRSSLSFVKIKYVEVLTFLQLLNLVLWIMEDVYHFMNIWVQFVSMVYVGLLGGAMYVNVFYLILHDPKILERDRELCVNLTALAITIGITAASISILIMDNTFLK